MGVLTRKSSAVWFVLALMMALAVGLACTSPAYAATSSKTISTTKYITYIKAGNNMYSWNYFKNIKEGSMKPREYHKTKAGLVVAGGNVNGTVSNLRCSNTARLVPTLVKKYGYINHTLKQICGATVKYTDRYTENNVKITNKVTQKCRYVNWVNPLKSFKIGAVQYAGKFKSDAQYNAKRALVGKVSAVAAPGWKIIKVRQNNTNIASGEGIPAKTLRNNVSSVSLKKSAESSVEVICYNTKYKYYSSAIVCPNFRYGVIYG